MKINNRVATIKMSKPSYGQEGGGVCWNKFLDIPPPMFIRILESPLAPCKIQVQLTDGRRYLLDINPFNNDVTYSERDNGADREITRDEFIMAVALTDPDTEQEYFYRYRHFRRPSDSWKQNCGWSEWEFCDVKKYVEIVTHIRDGSCTYEAQKIPAVPEETYCFDLKARGWHVPMYRYREQISDALGTEYTNWVVITRDHMWKLKRSEADRRDVWYEFEISRDGGENWEDL